VPHAIHVHLAFLNQFTPPSNRHKYLLGLQCISVTITLWLLAARWHSMKDDTRERRFQQFIDDTGTQWRIQSYWLDC